MLPDEIARTAQVPLAQKLTLRALANQYLDAFEGKARRNNVANAYAFLVEASLQVATGKDVSDAEEQLLISGFNNSIGATPQFAAMLPRDKQVLYESAVVTAGLMLFVDAQGRQTNNPQLRLQALETARSVIGHFFGVQVR